MNRLALWLIRRWAWLRTDTRARLFAVHGTNGVDRFDRWVETGSWK